LFRGTSTNDTLNRQVEGDTEEDEDDYMTEEDEDENDMDEDEDYEDEEEPLSAQRRANQQNRFSQSVVSRTSANDAENSPTLVQPGAKQTQFDLLALAKGLTSTSGPTLHEPDHVILETERLAEQVQESLHSDSPEKRADVLGAVAQELIATWQAASKSNSQASLSSTSRSGNAIGLSHASRLAALLLTLHHPPQVGLNQRTSALSLVPARSDTKPHTPIPRILLNWLNNTYSGASEVDVVLKESRGYSRHPSFWEAVHVALVRGNFAQTLQLLQGAQLEHAETADHDGLGSNGYSGSHLRHANEALRQAVDLLHECPAVASEDWDIKGHDWTIFRQRVQQVQIDLQEFSEGDSSSRHSVLQPFQASHFGISQGQASFQLSVASRKAESKVPWSVYDSLNRLYQLLLGNEEELLALSADWIEAVLALGVWWNGEEDDDLAQGSLAASRRSIMRSQRVRSADVTPVKAYCQRLSSALAAVIQNSDEDFGVNVTDRFEVGLACILDDNVEGVLQIMQGWSLTVASAVAELASAGEWFTRADGLLDNFDQSDLMVLSYNAQHQPKGVTKDDLLVAYSNLLASKGQITGKDGQTSREGWEMAIQTLGRLDDSISANERIERILDDLPLESSTRVDKITKLCYNLGLSQHAVTIAQVSLCSRTLRQTN
jgi:hypothetical protein